MMASSLSCDPALFPLIDALCAARLGAHDLRGAALGQAVTEVSDVYLRRESTPADLRGQPAALCARLKFFLPRDLPKIKAPLAELAAVSALPTRASLRVLDIGAGLGATSLGTADFLLAQPGVERVEIDALDIDAAALELASELSARWAATRGVQLRFATQCSPLAPATLARTRPPYDLVVLGFVLNELADRQADPVAHHQQWLLRLCELLAPEGALVVLEPALRQPSRILQEVRTRIAGSASSPYVFAPCLHRGPCPLSRRERDWCHQQLPLAFPEPLAAIARSAGLRAEGPSFSYLTLHRAQRSLAELDPAATLYRIVSGPLKGKGKLEFMVCGAADAERIRRLDRHESPHNQAVGALHRGDIVRVQPAVEPSTPRVEIGAETRVERVGPC